VTVTAPQPASAHDWIITIVCADQPGLVHAVTGGIVEAQGNIEESQQFHSPDTGRFFMRLRVSTDADEARMRAAMQPVIDRYDLDLGLREADRPTRTLVLVSKAPHCLQDLLFRQSAGQVNIEIPRVFGNHPDLADIAGFYGVPFTSLAIRSPEDKHAFEQRVMEYVEEHDIELVVLARYMQILSPELCDFLAGRAINIHHSFLPGFKGAKPLPAGSPPRGQAHRSDRALRHEGPRRGADHRAERGACRPLEDPRPAAGDRPGRREPHAAAGGDLVRRATHPARRAAHDHLPVSPGARHPAVTTHPAGARGDARRVPASPVRRPGPEPRARCHRAARAAGSAPRTTQAPAPHGDRAPAARTAVDQRSCSFT
jgi:formyltetrahydrofolate deformylase